MELSQNAGGGHIGQGHWDNLMYIYSYLKDRLRPINHVKTYGGDAVSWTRGDRHGIERFWRSIMGGAASMRFHRPPGGLGLNPKAQAQLKSARLLLERLDIFRCRPDAQSRLLLDRKPSEAYLSYEQGRQYGVYFPDGGSVQLQLPGSTGPYRLRWLDIAAGRWLDPKKVSGARALELTAPGKGNWIALLQMPR